MSARTTPAALPAYHLIGVGGAGMSVVAQLLAARGFAVSGSDREDSALLASLRQQGIDARVGHAAANVPQDAIVVRSSAIRPDNPELAYALARGQRVIHRSQALAIAAGDMDFVAVAGAHGKTTTSGMIATALSVAGIDPSFAVGSRIGGFGTGAHLGQGSLFIAEADESDGSFLNYRPRIAVVTNVEPDHLDFYRTRQAFAQAFVDFAGRIDEGGALITDTDDPGAARLAATVAADVRVIGYGSSTPPAGLAAFARITRTELGPEGSCANFVYDGRDYTLQVPCPGMHNVKNALAAWLVGVEAGVAPTLMARALASFRGTARRFETRAEVGGIRVVDDYAHHPTEVAALISQARIAAGDGRVLALFQPHLYSRTRDHAAAFAKALGAADRTVVCDIYGAREDPIPGVTSRLITDLMARGEYVADMDAAARRLAQQAHAGDLVLTVGAGSVTRAADTVIAALRRREGADG